MDNNFRKVLRHHHLDGSVTETVCTDELAWWMMLFYRGLITLTEFEEKVLPAYTEV